MPENKWQVAITTAPRHDCTLNECLESIRVCGWQDIAVFAEPGSTETDAKTVRNQRRLGVWHNFYSSCRWCLENTSADVILTVQDDSLFHPESKDFVDSILWPSATTGFVSLYTPKHYSLKGKQLRPTGVNHIRTSSLWGACAIAWPRKVLEQFVVHQVARNWLGARPRSGSKSVMQKRKDNPHMIANSDTAIGKVMNAMKRSMWFIDPSLVQHIARHSTINHGDNSGRRNAYRIADYEKVLSEQIPKPYATHGITA